MKQQRIKFSIGQDGTVYEQVYGIKGSQCMDLTKILEEKLGDVQWTKVTTDYYQPVNLNQNVTFQQNQDRN